MDDSNQPKAATTVTVATAAAAATTTAETVAADEASKTEHLLRKAETVLRQRTDRVLLVLERVLDTTNYIGCLRTAECLGIQNIWVVQLPRGHKKAEKQQQQPGKQKQKQGQAQGQGQGQRQGQGRGLHEGEQRPHKRNRQGKRNQQQGDAAACQDPEEVAINTLINETPTESHQVDVQQQLDICMDGEGQEVGTDAVGQGGGEEDVQAELVGLAEDEGGPSEDKLKQEIRRRLRFSRASSQWLDVQFFWSVQSCIDALKRQGWTIWATDLSKASVNLLTSAALEPLPDKVAIIMGREADGVSKEMLAAADRRVYLPTFGFTSSLNVMVATGVVLQATLARWPQLRGHMSDDRRRALRTDWYGKLARNEAHRAQLMARVDDPPQPYDEEDMKDLLAVAVT